MSHYIHEKVLYLSHIVNIQELTICMWPNLKIDKLYMFGNPLELQDLFNDLAIGSPTLMDRRNYCIKPWNKMQSSGYFFLVDLTLILVMNTHDNPTQVIWDEFYRWPQTYKGSSFHVGRIRTCSYSNTSSLSTLELF